MYLGFLVKCQILLPDLDQIWNFLTDFCKSPQYQIAWKSVQWDSTLIRMDTQMDR